MAKKDKDKETTVDEESTGSKVVTALIVIVIVIIWLGIFIVLIKLDVGHFGSNVLYPVLKDVPALSWILPDKGSDGGAAREEYDNLTEANARIRELESQLAATSSSDSANSSEIEELPALSARPAASVASVRRSSHRPPREPGQSARLTAPTHPPGRCW